MTDSPLPPSEYRLRRCRPPRSSPARPKKARRAHWARAEPTVDGPGSGGQRGAAKSLVAPSINQRPVGCSEGAERARRGTTWWWQGRGRAGQWTKGCGRGRGLVLSRASEGGEGGGGAVAQPAHRHPKPQLGQIGVLSEGGEAACRNPPPVFARRPTHGRVLWPGPCRSRAVPRGRVGRLGGEHGHARAVESDLHPSTAAQRLIIGP